VTGTALFFGPHPDDVELFAGGTAARCVRLGHRLVICDLTRGERASNGNPELRADEAAAAAVALGAAERLNLGLPDGGLRADDAAQLRAVVEAIRAARPDVVVAPWRDDRHPDHEAGCELVRRACFFAGLRAAEADGAPHRPSSLLHYLVRVDAAPTFVVPLEAADVAAKWRAIEAHASQVGPAPSQVAGRAPTLVGETGFREVLAARDRTWGAHAGVAAAEPFVAARTYVDDDPVAWALAHPGDAVHWFPGGRR
jgi:bacillithiol biosynthesis deacetylase BshB1